MSRGFPDYLGDKAGLYLFPEWAAREGRDKNFSATGENKATAIYSTVTYTVPAGKTLYITQLSFYSWAFNAADRDNNQMCVSYIYDWASASFIWGQGGNGGGLTIFSKPIVFTAGQKVTFYITNLANHNCNIGVFAGGYEL